MGTTTASIISTAIKVEYLRPEELERTSKNTAANAGNHSTRKKHPDISRAGADRTSDD